MGKYHCIAHVPLGAALTAALVATSPAILGAEDGRHAPLVDPARTKCAVCHKTLQGDQHEGVAEGGCLSCHRFVRREGSTTVELVGQPLTPSPVAHEDGAQGPGPEWESEGTGSAGQEQGGAPTPGSHGMVGEPPPPLNGAPSAPAAPASEVGAPSSRSADDLYARGLEAFAAGEVDLALASWHAMVEERAGRYTVQVEMDDYLESARSTIERYPAAQLYVVRKGGKYHVLSGFYPDLEEATAAVQELPAALRAGGAFPTPAARLLKP